MKPRLILICTLILASILRLYALAGYPSGLNADEASLGYNSYSLLLTGKDEHGHPWPVNLESFGDFKPAGYSYILLPFIKILGLNEFAVRFPSALFGILSVALLYIFVKQITQSSKLANISALLLAISPWHLHFSRGAWETNVATTLVLGGVCCYLRWTKSLKLKWLILFVLLFVSSMYIYQSTRLISPLFGLILGLISIRLLINNKTQFILSIAFGVFLLTPLFISIISSDAGSRLNGVGLLADTGPVNRVNELRGQHTNWNSLFSRVLHNQFVEYGTRFIQNYTDHFSGDFLFVNGDKIERNRVPETGLLYLTDFILLAVGIYTLVKNPYSQSKILWLWLLISPLASSLTFQTPNALRAQNMIIPLTVLLSLGFDKIINFKPKLKPILIICLGLIYVWQFSRYLHQYYVHYPQEYPAAWEYGFRQLVPLVESLQSGYKRIIVTDYYDQPYILFLFYSQLNPLKFQNAHLLTPRDKFNFSTVRNYDKYEFTSTPWDKVRDIHSSLIVTAPKDLPDSGVNILNRIYFPNGKPAFNIVSN